MGGVSPVLYRPDLSKFMQVSKFLAAAQIFTISCENSKILSRLLSVLSLPRKFIYDHCCCPNSAIILTDSKMEAIFDFGRGCQYLGGGGSVGGGMRTLVSAPLPAQTMRVQVAPGHTAANLILVINPVSLSFSFTSLYRSGWTVVDQNAHTIGARQAENFCL